MKQLTEYTKNQNHYKITHRIEEGKKTFGLFHCEALSRFSPYELIEIQHHDGRENFGQYFPPTEYPPSNNEWGQKGWTFTTEEKALLKLAQLIKYEKEQK